MSLIFTKLYKNKKRYHPF